jgi:nucleoside-diphosphate-sugar epimerase
MLLAHKRSCLRAATPLTPSLFAIPTSTEARQNCHSPPNLYSITHELDGATVFLTGATGYVGSLVLEQLLRTTDVARVYVLIRGRRGLSAEQRLATLMGSPIFHLMRGRPSLINKVVAIQGDVEACEMALAASDRAILVQQTDIMIHCAADIRLEVDIQTSLRANYEGTGRVLDLATDACDHGRGKLRAYVHVSTAFVNMNQPRGSSVAERIYPLRYESSTDLSDEHIVAELMALDPAAAEARAEALCALWDFANNYVLGKHLGEQLVVRRHKEWTLPPDGTVIVRPSLVSSISRAPVPGYCGNFAGPLGAAAAAATGLYGPLAGVASSAMGVWDIVPGDMVASVILGTAAAASAGVVGRIWTAAEYVRQGRHDSIDAALRGLSGAAPSSHDSYGHHASLTPSPVQGRSTTKIAHWLHLWTNSCCLGASHLADDDDDDVKDARLSHLPHWTGAKAGEFESPCIYQSSPHTDCNSARVLIVHACASSTYPITLMEGWNLAAEFITAHPPLFSLRGSMSVIPRMPRTFMPCSERVRRTQTMTGLRVAAARTLLRVLGQHRSAARLEAGYASMLVQNNGRTCRSLIFETHALLALEAALCSTERFQRLLVWRPGPGPTDAKALSSAYRTAPVVPEVGLPAPVVDPSALPDISWRAFIFTQLAGVYVAMFQMTLPRRVDASVELKNRQRNAWWRRLLGVAGKPESWSSQEVESGQAVTDGSWAAAAAMGVVEHDFVFVGRVNK